jgi:hypothetical protein
MINSPAPTCKRTTESEAPPEVTPLIEPDLLDLPVWELAFSDLVPEPLPVDPDTTVIQLGFAMVILFFRIN